MSGVILPVVDYKLLGALIAVVDAAVSLGAAAIILEEHPGEVLDPFVVLAHLGQLYEELSLGALLHSDSGRPPSIIAKLLSGLDVVTDGRGFVVIGDLDDRHVAASARDVEAVELVARMVTSDSTTMQGRYFRVEDAWNLPRRTTRTHFPAKVSRALSAARLIHDEIVGVQPPSAAMIQVQAGEARAEDKVRELNRTASLVSVVTVGDAPPELRIDSLSQFLRWRTLPSEAMFTAALQR